nr:unnamed protein product [Digitaria exilis]
MATPWVILGRVIRVGVVPGGVEVEKEAQAEVAAAVDADAQPQAKQVAAVEAEEGEKAEGVRAVQAEADAQAEDATVVDADSRAQAEQVAAVEAQAKDTVAAVGAGAAQVEHAAAEPDFTLQVAPPPRVSVLTAGRSVHPDPGSPDKYPYIVAAAPSCLLAHFAAAPCRGTQFDDRSPPKSHLVLVRGFHTAAGEMTASAELVPDRTGSTPILRNIGSVVLAPNDGADYTIAELRVDKGSDRATIVYLRLGGREGWSERHLRRFAPGAALALPQAPRIPDARDLGEETPHIHTKRSVTTSRNKLRYVEINGEAATVSMWTRRRSRIPGAWQWDWNRRYTVAFEEIWDDKTYKDTGLPRIVPMLAIVCPSDPNLVSFALHQQIFGVNSRAQQGL